MRDILGAVRVLSDGGFQWLGDPKNVSPIRVGSTFFPLLQSSCQQFSIQDHWPKGPSVRDGQEKPCQMVWGCSFSWANPILPHFYP